MFDVRCVSVMISALIQRVAEFDLIGCVAFCLCVIYVMNSVHCVTALLVEAFGDV